MQWMFHYEQPYQNYHYISEPNGIRLRFITADRQQCRHLALINQPVNSKFEIWWRIDRLRSTINTILLIVASNWEAIERPCVHAWCVSPGWVNNHSTEVRTPRSYRALLYCTVHTYHFSPHCCRTYPVTWCDMIWYIPWFHFSPHCCRTYPMIWYDIIWYNIYHSILVHIVAVPILWYDTM